MVWKLSAHFTINISCFEVFRIFSKKFLHRNQFLAFPQHNLWCIFIITPIITVLQMFLGISHWFKDNCPRGKLPPPHNLNSNPNPKQNLNPNRGPIILGGQLSRYHFTLKIFHISQSYNVKRYCINSRMHRSKAFRDDISENSCHYNIGKIMVDVLVILNSEFLFWSFSNSSVVISQQHGLKFKRIF